MRARTKTLVGLVGAIVLLVVAAVFFGRRSLPNAFQRPLPVPNGYDDLIAAGKNIQNKTYGVSRLKETELRELVGAYSNTMQTARAGLSKKIQVPVEFTISYAGNHLSELTDLKLIAVLFLAESRLAELEQRSNDGAQSALDAFRLGIKCQRGGTLIDALVGTSIENMATAQLEPFVDSSDAKSCREIARTMEDLDTQKQSWEEILKQEHYWTRRAFPDWQHVVAGWFTYKQKMAEEAKGEQRFNTQQAKTRGLMIEFASRAYELENGHRPNSIHDLVPGYLKTVPQDPATTTSPPP